MNQYWFVLLLVLFVRPVLASTPLDSLKKRITQLEVSNNRLRIGSQKKTDSLLRELQFYKVKEDYYASSVSDALNDQTSRFGFILAVLLTVAGLISWGVIKWEVVAIKKEVGSNKEENKKFNEENRERLKYSTGLLNVTILNVLHQMLGSSAMSQKVDEYIETCILTLSVYVRLITMLDERDLIGESDIREPMHGVASLMVSKLNEVLEKGSGSLDWQLLASKHATFVKDVQPLIEKIDDRKTIEQLTYFKIQSSALVR